MVHLVDIKFGELVCDVNWWIFSLATKKGYTDHIRKPWIHTSVDIRVRDSVYI